MTEARARVAALTAIGAIHGDDGSVMEVRLLVSGGVRQAGRGPIELRLAGDGLELIAAELIWLVTTNKGWAHMRGDATLADGQHLPFRADLYAAGVAGDPDSDRFALRIYAAGDDPNRSSPIRKLGGWMDAGSIAI